MTKILMAIRGTIYEYTIWLRLRMGALDHLLLMTVLMEEMRLMAFRLKGETS